MPSDVNKYRVRLLLMVVFGWLLLLLLADGSSVKLVFEYGYFFFLGLLGAIVANSTGAGGGIIFIPFFSSLGIEGTRALGTSILIQCFGMTAGAVSWLTASQIVKAQSSHLNKLIFQLMIVCGASSILGVIAGQYFIVLDNASFMTLLFKAFSVVFGFVLLGIIFYSHKQIHTQFDLLKFDGYTLFVVSFIGGLITAWISVGVGEIIAIILILRRYPTMVAISMGVIVSAVTVIAAAYHHVSVLSSVYWLVVLFAVPGAILGGTFAYKLSEMLGPTRLKIFFSIWIILTGLSM